MDFSKLVFELHHGPIDGHFSIDITKNVKDMTPTQLVKHHIISKFGVSSLGL